MKKWIAMVLCLVMVMAMFAGCGKDEAPAADVEVPGSALEILENIWALYGEEEKFPVMGGDVNNLVDGAPGAYDVSDTEMLTYQLLVPADQAANVTEAASLIHAMMVNNFTCGVFRVGEVRNEFAEAMYNAVKNNQWMCGFPDSVLVSVIGGEYVLMAFGINDAMDPFEAKLQEAYPDARIVYDEPVV